MVLGMGTVVSRDGCISVACCRDELGSGMTLKLVGIQMGMTVAGWFGMGTNVFSLQLSKMQ